jgi:hypothetical protein
MFALLHFLKECVKIFKKPKSKKQQHLVPFLQTHRVKKFLNKTKFEDLNYFIFQGDIEK